MSSGHQAFDRHHPSTRTAPTKRRPPLFVLLLVSGCVLAPKAAERERLRVAEAGTPYAAPVAERTIPELPADADWPDLLRRAFLANGDLEAAYFEWVAAVERIDVAAGYPNTNVSLGFEYLFSGGNLKGWERTSLGLGFDPMQNLSFPTKVVAAGRIAFEEARAAGRRFAAAKFALQRDVLDAWLDYALLAEEVRLQGEQVALLRLASASAAARVEIGMRQEDLLGIAVAQEQADTRLRTLESALPQQRARLNALLGRLPDAPLSPPALPAPRPLAVDDAALLAIAVDANPELEALAHTAHGRADALDLARQQYIPDVNPFVGITGSMEQVVGAAISLGTQIPQIRAGIRAARASLRGSEAMLRQARHQREAAFVAALLALRDAERQRAVLEEVIQPLAALAADNAAQINAVGDADLTAVIDAERTVIDVRWAIAEARILRERQLAAIEQLAGIDVELLDTDAGRRTSASARASGGGS